MMMEPELRGERAMGGLTVLHASGAGQCREPASCSVLQNCPFATQKDIKDASLCHCNYGQEQETFRGKRLTVTLSLGIGRQLGRAGRSKGLHGTILFLKYEVQTLELPSDIKFGHHAKPFSRLNTNVRKLASKSMYELVLLCYIQSNTHHLFI